MTGTPLSASGEPPEEGGRDHRQWSRLLQGVSIDLFVVSLCAYALLATLESMDPGWVSNFFNLDVLLVLVLASGAVALSSPRSWGGPEAAARGKRSYQAWVLGLGALGWVLTWRATEGLGIFSLMISLGSAALIIFCCWLLGTVEASA